MTLCDNVTCYLSSCIGQSHAIVSHKSLYFLHQFVLAVLTWGQTSSVLRRKCQHLSSCLILWSPASQLFLQLVTGTENVSHKTCCDISDYDDAIIYQIPYFVQSLTQGCIWQCFIPFHSALYPVYHTSLDTSSKVVILLFITPNKSFCTRDIKENYCSIPVLFSIQFPVFGLCYIKKVKVTTFV